MTEQGSGGATPPEQPIVTGSVPANVAGTDRPVTDQPDAGGSDTDQPGAAASSEQEPTLAAQPPAAMPPPPWTAQPVAPASTAPPAASAATDRRAIIAVGAALILLGAFFLLVQVAGTDFGDLGWPLFVIAPGVILYVIGFIMGGRNGVGFAVAGSIVSAVGLVLAFQNATDAWESWAYAWALVGPFAAGFGMLTYGLAYRYDDLVREGVGALGIGAALFLIGFVFFEGVLGLSGEPMPVARDLFPYASIALGAVLIVLSLFTGKRPAEAA